MFCVLASAWEQFVQKHRPDCKAPLQVVQLQVSSSLLYVISHIFIYQGSNHWMTRGFFSRKVVFAAGARKQSMWILRLRVPQPVLEQNLSREGASKFHIYFNQLLVYMVKHMYINTFS